MRLWKLAAVLAALAALGLYGLYACIFCSDRSAGAAGPSGSAGAARREIVLRIPTWPMQSLDPIIWKPELVLLQGTIMEGLFGYDRDHNIVPKVAKAWELSPDHLTWTIHLRTDKKWSNGDAVTAHDYIFGWTRFISPDVPSETWASMFPNVDNAMEFKGASQPIDSVGFKALDDSTLTVRTVRPKSLPSFLAMGSALPVHRKTYEAAKAAGEGDGWCLPPWFVGNGPYMPVSFVRDGEAELVKNPHYVGERGNVDRFILKAMNMSSQNVQIQQFEAGELDLAQVLTLGDYAYATKAAHLKDRVVKTPEIGFMGVQMAHTVNKLMNDDKLRRAIALAIDREDIAKNVMGGRVVPTQVYGPPGDTLFRGLRTHDRDVEEAKRLVKASSYKGEEIYLFSTPATDVQGLAMVSEVIQAQLRLIGLNVVVENMEQDLLTGVLASYVWGGGYLDDKRYTRPGLTLFPGKMLWIEPVMLVRGQDCVWFWMNFDYALKEARKRITLEMVKIREEDKGNLPEHWDELKPLRDSAFVWYRRIRETEPDTLYRNKVAETDPAVEFDRVRASVTAATPKADAVGKWQSAKQRLLDAHFNSLTYLMNAPNWEGNRLYANLEVMTLDDPQVAVLTRRLLQLTLDQDWIIPLVSENLVYLKQPWLKGEAIYKLGVWNFPFNLHEMTVDEAAWSGTKADHGAVAAAHTGAAPEAAK